MNEQIEQWLAELQKDNKQLRAEKEALKKTLKKVLKSKQLVLPKGLIKAEHWDEAAVLLEMYTEVEQALKEIKVKCERED